MLSRYLTILRCASVISYVNTVGKAHFFTAVFSQLTVFTADSLRHPIQMPGIEAIWELHTLTVITPGENVGEDLGERVTCVTSGRREGRREGGGA